MNDKKPAAAAKKTNKLLVVLLIGAFFLVLILGFYYLPREADVLKIRSVLSSAEDLSINWRFGSRVLATQTTALGTGTKINRGQGVFRNITIASIDGPTIQHFGSYPLDRGVWVKMLDSFNDKDPEQKIVFFDLSFSGADMKNKTDQALVNSVKKFKGSVGEDINLYAIPGIDLSKIKGLDDFSEKELKQFTEEGQDYHSKEVQALKKFELNVPARIKGVKAFTRFTPVFPELTENLSFVGSINMDTEDEKQEIFRKQPLVVTVYYYYRDQGEIKITNVYYPSATLAMAAKVLKSDIKNIVLEKNAIVIRNAVQNDKTGDFSIPVDENYRMSVNYKAIAGSSYIRTIPVKDIMNAGLPRNSVVMVGVYVQGTAANVWGSPVGSMFSVEHMAYSLGTIINRDFISEVPDWINILYVILLTLLVGFLVSKGIRTTIVAFLLSLGIPFGLGFGLFQLNIQIATMIPLISSILVLIAGEIFIILTEGREKRYIKSTFSKYVNPDLVNILIQNPDMIQLGGQDVDATLLFSDIRSFTTLSEGMTPIELISFLNIYLSRMTDIVMETHGTLDKYIGDAVVAFWGTPVKLENHAFNACQAAVKMMQALRQFNEEQGKLGKKPINIGIGLNSGTITVGNVGSDKKKNYTAIGEATQLAEDLQDANKEYKTNITISEYTYEMVKDRVIARQTDLIYVKGKDKPIRIYELIDIKE